MCCLSLRWPYCILRFHTLNICWLVMQRLKRFGMEPSFLEHTRFKQTHGVSRLAPMSECKGRRSRHSNSCLKPCHRLTTMPKACYLIAWRGTKQVWPGMCFFPVFSSCAFFLRPLLHFRFTFNGFWNFASAHLWFLPSLKTKLQGLAHLQVAEMSQNFQQQSFSLVLT